MPLEADDIMRIQQMVRDAMPRTEYENRHSELIQRVTRMEDGLRELARKHLDDIDTVNKLITHNQDGLRDRIDEANKQIDVVIALVNQHKSEFLKNMNDSRDLTIRYMVAIIVSFVITIVTTIFTHIIK